MRHVLGLIMACGIAVSGAQASEQRFASGYWDRGYATGNMSAVIFNLSIKVDDLTKAESAVTKRLTKAGGSLQNMNNNSGYYGDAQAAAKRIVKNISFTLDSSKGEAAAKGLFDIGDLQQYSSSQQAAASQLEEIRAKLKQVQEELSTHADELKKMPIASYFLEQLQSRLTNSQDAYVSGLKRATINVALIEEKSEK